MSESSVLCNLCKKTFSSNGFKQHMRSKHISDGLRCKYCPDYVIDAQYKLTQHITNKHVKQKTTMSELEEMMEKALISDSDSSTDDEEALQCNYCPFITSTKWSLIQHASVKHNVELQFGNKCKFCSYVNKKMSRVRSHTRRKHGVDKFEFICPHCKDYSVDVEEFLITHMKDKHGKNGNVYKCQFCSSVFNSHEEIQEHLLLSHKYYSCFKSKCTIISRNLISLGQHINDSHGRDTAESYECRYCHCGFPYLFSMAQHKVDFHGVSVEQKIIENPPTRHDLEQYFNTM